MSDLRVDSEASGGAVPDARAGVVPDARAGAVPDARGGAAPDPRTGAPDPPQTRILCVRVPKWPVAAGVRAAFTERMGGVSRAPFDTLNLASHVGDAPEAVAENRRRLHERLVLSAEPHWLEQVHGAEVVDLDATPGRAPASPRADAAFTRTPGQPCVILVADCLAVLMTDRRGAVVAAAHAGWRGLAAGVLAATVRALAVDPAELLAWLSPAIGPQHFEVGNEVRVALGGDAARGGDGTSGADGALAAAFQPNARGRWQCDLAAVARAELTRLGVGAVYGDAACSYAERERFFSYRRDGQCGRMAALIWLEP